MSEFKNLTVNTSSYIPGSSPYFSATLPATTRVLTGSPGLKSAGLQSATLHLEDSLKEIKRRYETEARTIQKNYEVDYNNHINLLKELEDLQALLTEERQRSFEFESKYNGAVNELEKERRLRKEQEVDLNNYQENYLKTNNALTASEMENGRLRQENAQLHSEVAALKKEHQRLRDLYNRKLGEFEDSYSAKVRELSADIESLRSQIELQRASYEKRLQGIESESGVKLARYEEKVRSQERQIGDFEIELKKKVELIAKLKLEYEEELGRQVALVREEEKYRSEVVVNDLERRYLELEEDRELVLRKNQELGRELIVKEKSSQDLRTKAESEIGRLKMEIGELRELFGVLETEKSQVEHELADLDVVKRRLENEVRNLERGVDKLKEIHSQEVNRLVNDHNIERRRYEDAERLLAAKVEELERYVRGLESENDKMKGDIGRLKEMVTGNVQKTLFQTFESFQTLPAFERSSKVNFKGF